MPSEYRHGDALATLREMPAESVDAVITDPPYGLSNTAPANVADTITRWATGEREYTPAGKGFMGNAWDSFVPPPAVWDECYRVLKPGGHIAVFAGSRTQDLMGLSIRLAGFDIRDSIAWLYGSGFPKSMDVSKAIDKAAGVEQKIVGFDESKRARNPNVANMSKHAPGGVFRWGDIHYKWENLPQTGRDYFTKRHETQGQITAPATPEAQKWAGWGTALKPGHEPIILARKPFKGTVANNVQEHGTGAINIDATRLGTEGGTRATNLGELRGTMYDRGKGKPTNDIETLNAGRWPANVALDAEAAAELEETARFFYCAKAPTRERPNVDGISHPTVKPLELMKWLCRMVTPPDGLILDPFTGSGTTLEAAEIEGFNSIGIEADATYLPLIAARLERAAGAA